MHDDGKYTPIKVKDKLENVSISITTQNIVSSVLQILKQISLMHSSVDHLSIISGTKTGKVQQLLQSQRPKSGYSIRRMISRARFDNKKIFD